MSQARREAGMLSLNLAYAVTTQGTDGQPLSLSALVDRYETVNRAGDPSLPSGDAFLAGTAARHAVREMRRLAAELSATPDREP